MTDKEVVSISLSTDLLKWVESESDNRSAFIERLLKQARDGGSEIDHALTEAEIARVKKRVNARQAELDAELAYLDDLRKKKAEHVTTSEEYDATLDSLLDEVEANDGHVWPASQDVLDIADRFDTPAAEVMEDLKERAAAEGYDLTTHNFMRADEARMVDNPPRPIDEVVDDGS